MIKAGDTLEAAIWLDGKESPTDVEQWKADVPLLIISQYPGLRVRLSPTRYEIKRPGADRVPPVPSRVTGPDVRLLVAEADVLSVSAILPSEPFISQLSTPDLKRLRKITRRAARCILDDRQVDAIIEHLGPISGMRALKAAVDTGSVH